MSETIPILGVTGRPILHSMSPALFRELFRASGTEAAYTRVAASSAAEAIGLFRSLGMRGMNVTAPFKEPMSALVDELTPDARELGAVNCLVAGEGGRVLGANTDSQGALGALRGKGVDVAGKRCLVIGAGGAGKAAARALSRAGGDVVIANRTLARAEVVAAQFGCAAGALEKLPELAVGAAVIVSTLTSDTLPHPETWLPDDSSAVVLDADYKWAILARYAAERGMAVATGADWLVFQALPAYELFMGQSAEAPRLRAREAGDDSAPNSFEASLATNLSRAARPTANGRKVALVGLMGAGKTQVGRVLAKLLKTQFIDADKEIEADAGMSVAAIFAKEGESGFRSRELRTLERITSWPGPAVVAAGGGAATVRASARMLSDRCLCVWLHVSPETAAQRTRGGQAQGHGGFEGPGLRPLLDGGDPETRLRALEAERRGAYASCAELAVSTEGRDARSVAEVIYEEIDRVS